MTQYHLFLQLLKAETEDEIDAILKEAGYFNHDPVNWPALSDWNNNWTLVGAQNTNPTGALVEKLINAVDHVLIAGCWRAGIDPESDQAPAAISDAARDFFKVRNGRLDSLTPAERTSLADNIHLVATGPKSAPNYLIIDKGEGQSPARFPSTFLSLQGQNKYSVRFVQGINNCGSSAVLRFCGMRKYQLIVSRRDPDCPNAVGDTTTDQWGFTLVRELWPERQKRPRPMFVYLAPEGIIASFKADEIPVLPVVEERGKPPKPYSGGLRSGTCIKVFDYAWPTRSLATTNARDELEKYLYSLALPVRISETRDYSANYFQTTLSGLAVNIADKESNGDRVEKGFSQLPLKLNLPEIVSSQKPGGLGCAQGDVRGQSPRERADRAGMRSDAGGFPGLLSDQVGQGRDLVKIAYAILKITPEGHAELPASRLQAQEGVPTPSARVTPRARADLPLLDVLPDIVLGQVVVQRNFRVVEDH